MQGEDRTDPVTLTAFLAIVLVAGGNPIAIRYSSCVTCELDPFWAAAIRFLLAGLVFAVIAWLAQAHLPRGRALRGALLYGALQFGAAFGLIYWGFERAPAGLGQVLLACVPLLTFGLAVAQRQEQFRIHGLIGGILAVAGIAVIFSGGVDAGVPLTSMFAIVGAAVCWAMALIVVKGFPPLEPAMMNAIGMGSGTLILLAMTVIFDEARVIPDTAPTVAALVYLVIAGSVGVFWLYIFVLRDWSASATSYQLVLIPLVTISLSTVLQEEKVTWVFALGSALVLVGVYFGALRRDTRRGRYA
jgi:drug/metabolite transporter (DMT)-like permease